MSELLSRKFIFAILAILIGLILVIIKEVDGKAYLSFVEIVGGTYVIGNVATKVVVKPE